MLMTVAVKNLSLEILLIRPSPSVLDLFLMREHSELGGIKWDIAKMVYMIREVTEQMYLNKVEMRFPMDHVHTELVLLIRIVFKGLAPL